MNVPICLMSGNMCLVYTCLKTVIDISLPNIVCRVAGKYQVVGC